MTIYIAADSPLPLIEWQEDITPFYVSELSEDEKRVIKQFTRPFVAYAGSYEGCGCGFSYDDDPIEDENDTRENALSRESVKQLSDYLSDLVKSGTVELFACWDGDQEAEPKEKLIVAPDYFGGETFAFEEKQFLTVTQK